MKLICIKGLNFSKKFRLDKNLDLNFKKFNFF